MAEEAPICPLRRFPRAAAHVPGSDQLTFVTRIWDICEA